MMSLALHELHIPPSSYRNQRSAIDYFQLKSSRHSSEPLPVHASQATWSVSVVETFFFFYLIRIYWLTAPMKSSHMFGSTVLRDAETFFRLICSQSSLLPDCLESVPLSPSHPQQKHVITATDVGKQTNTLVRAIAKTHNPTDSNKSFAKLHGQTVMIVCIGLRFVIPIISPVCYNGIPCHLDTFVKKGQIHLRLSHCKYHIYNCRGYESCCVKLRSLCVSVPVNEHHGLTLCKY